MTTIQAPSSKIGMPLEQRSRWRRCSTVGRRRSRGRAPATRVLTWMAGRSGTRDTRTVGYSSMQKTTTSNASCLSSVSCPPFGSSGGFVVWTLSKLDGGRRRSEGSACSARATRCRSARCVHCRPRSSQPGNHVNARRACERRHEAPPESARSSVGQEASLQARQDRLARPTDGSLVCAAALRGSVLDRGSAIDRREIPNPPQIPVPGDRACRSQRRRLT